MVKVSKTALYIHILGFHSSVLFITLINFQLINGSNFSSSFVWSEAMLYVKFY